MTLIQTLEKHVAELRAKIEECHRVERSCVAEINLHSERDVRGETPHVSRHIQQLDITRREAQQSRRQLQRDLSQGQATLRSAQAVVAR